MNFLALQDRLLDRLNLSSDEARDRIKTFINDRLRELQTSCNLGRIRRGTVYFLTTPSGSTTALTSVVKVFTITPSGSTPPLVEKTPNFFRRRTVSYGQPALYAVPSFEYNGCTLEWSPVPDAAYPMQVEGLLPGTDLVEDDDVPAMPKDFTDALVFGCLADEYNHFDKADIAATWEAKYEKRKRDLRYFIQRSRYLTRVQGSRSSETDFWWRVA